PPGAAPRGTPATAFLPPVALRPPPPPPPPAPPATTQAPPLPTAQAAGGVLTVTGTPGNDALLLLPAGKQKKQVRVLVVADGRVLGTFAARLLLVSGQAGDDLLLVSRGLKLPALRDGGPGNDVLLGGGGRNVLLGGPGNDVLVRGTPRDVLDGGPGQDGAVFAGTPGDDLIRVGWLSGPLIQVAVNGRVDRE